MLWSRIAVRQSRCQRYKKHEDKADQQVWVKESWSNLFGKEQYKRR